MRKKYLSFTQINMFLRCPRQYEFRYMEGLKTLPSGALAFGRSWHSTLEFNYRQKIKTETDLPLSDMHDCFSDEWEKVLAEEEIVFEEKPEKLKNMGISVVEVHHTNIAPGVQPVMVEEKFRVSLGEDFLFDLLGFWDVVDKNGVIIDNKSYSKTKSQADIDKDLQLTAYSLGYRISTGKIEKGLRIDSVIKTKQPKAVQISTSRTNDDCRWFLGLIERVSWSIKSGVFYPNPNGWHCSPKWCGYWEKCKGRAK